MKQKKLAALLSLLLATGLVLGLAGCGKKDTMPTTSVVETSETEEGGGTILLRVNPEIAVTFDAEGIVTRIEGRNDDARKVVKMAEDLIGRPSREAVALLIAALNENGYLVEDVEGKANTITIELEDGSELPTAAFLQEIIADVRRVVTEIGVSSPIRLNRGGDDWSNYDVSDYGKTDRKDDTNLDNTAFDDDTHLDDTNFDNPDTDYDDTDFDDSPYVAPTTTRPTTAAPKPDTDYDDSPYNESPYDASDYDASDYD